MSSNISAYGLSLSQACSPCAMHSNVLSRQDEMPVLREVRSIRKCNAALFGLQTNPGRIADLEDAVRAQPARPWGVYACGCTHGFRYGLRSSLLASSSA